eukprot:12650020-Alexandrium_andersonii.AAC.1
MPPFAPLAGASPGWEASPQAEAAGRAGGAPRPSRAGFPADPGDGRPRTSPGRAPARTRASSAC